jgi:hypothetical protein
MLLRRERILSTARIYDKFEALLAEMGQNAPKDDGEREIFRRLFFAGYFDGWEAAEDVGWSTHLMRLLHLE